MYFHKNKGGKILCDGMLFFTFLVVISSSLSQHMTKRCCFSELNNIYTYLYVLFYCLQYRDYWAAWNCPFLFSPWAKFKHCASTISLAEFSRRPAASSVGKHSAFASFEHGSYKFNMMLPKSCDGGESPIPTDPFCAAHDFVENSSGTYLWLMNNNVLLSLNSILNKKKNFLLLF